MAEGEAPPGWPSPAGAAFGSLLLQPRDSGGGEGAEEAPQRRASKPTAKKALLEEQGPPRPDASAPRSCLQCGTTTTPMWRSGPAGMKTLCNGCGVRHSRGGQPSRGRRGSKPAKAARAAAPAAPPPPTHQPPPQSPPPPAPAIGPERLAVLLRRRQLREQAGLPVSAQRQALGEEAQAPLGGAHGVDGPRCTHCRLPMYAWCESGAPQLCHACVEAYAAGARGIGLLLPVGELPFFWSSLSAFQFHAETSSWSGPADAAATLFR